MDAHRLVQMANDIGSFFEAGKDRTKAEKEVADHIRNFWEPRMRRELLACFDREGGAGLTEFVRESIRNHRRYLSPL